MVSDVSLDLTQFERILVIGGGKASAGMALEVERILGNKMLGGSVNIPVYTKPWPRSSRIEFNPATHPIPSEKGVRGVKKMLQLVDEPSRRDLVMCLISGGGSALMPFPAKGVRLSDKQQTTELLLKSGATIQETNTVRKHLSGIKGGRLAEKLFPSTVVSVIVSDVVGDDPESIASGPTVPDYTTFEDAFNVLQRHGLWHMVPKSVRYHISRGRRGGLEETPKSRSSVFRQVHNVIVGSSKVACEAAAKALRKRGYRPLILSTRIQGEARDVGRILTGIVSDIRRNQIPFSPPAALVAGGETTVTVHGKGRGGRNQELALASAFSLGSIPGVLFASIGTDGVDGPTDAAGAVVDGTTIERGLKMGLDAQGFLDANNSYPFFKKLGDLIVTGPTGTNVNDVMIAIVENVKQKHDRTRKSVRH